MAVAFPTTPAPNQVVTDPVTNATWRWDAPSQRWVPAATGATFITQGALDSALANYLPLTGGSLSGSLTVNGDATVTGELAFTPGGTTFAFGWANPNTGYPVPQDFGMMSLSVNGGANGAMVRTFWQAGVNRPIHLIRAENTAGTTIGAYMDQTFLGTWSAAQCDAQLKHDLEPAGDGLAAVNAVPVHSATYAHPSADVDQERWDYTLLAQQVREALPFAYMDAPANGYASLHPLHLIATLWRAVQQLSARVQELEAKA